MRFHYTVVLLVGAFFANAGADSAVTNAKATTTNYAEMARSLTVNQYKRLLRADKIVHEDVEERGIASALKSLPGVDKAKELLLKQKLAAYLKNEKSADDVFTKLNLAKTGDKLFESPKFLAWSKYVDDFNMKQKDPEKVVSKIPTLTKQFGDASLAKMLEVAAQSPSTKRLAESLQAQQLKSWTEAGLSVDDVFRRLNLNTGLDDILTNPLFLTFNKYLVDFNTWNPGKSTTMVETLARSYGDIPVAKMLEAATKVDDTKAMATRLQGQQRDVWKDMGLNVDDVYSQVLRLDSTTGNLFENPNFAVWTKFVDDFSGGKTSSFEALWKILGEKTLVQKLVVSSQTKRNSTVRELQNDLIRKWLSLKTPPAQVSKLLGTSFEGTTLASRYKWNFSNQ
ncbi:hypothetical protein KRP22_004614 [Phytophthora ramorum]|uniref:RxLR effector protein PSR2 n=1 Tax=Phytophthora ramorum TaxID=164328 RepID=UPI0030B0DD7C|nr:RxLR effector protein PSR2 [Phytophthora ramorum]KAH7499626.1 RxLR effector protein PSR2 [Phytophthora ramorum]